LLIAQLVNVLDADYLAAPHNATTSQYGDMILSLLQLLQKTYGRIKPQLII